MHVNSFQSYIIDSKVQYLLSAFSLPRSLSQAPVQQSSNPSASVRRVDELEEVEEARPPQTSGLAPEALGKAIR